MADHTLYGGNNTNIATQIYSRKTMENDDSKEWEKYHFTRSSDSSTPRYTKNLYTDDSPCTTIKGMGFKDAKSAKLTIELSGQPGCKYKQYWTIRAMYERARNHPSQTLGMKNAMDILCKWMKDRDVSEKSDSLEMEQELLQRKQLTSSKANAHARSNFMNNDEFQRITNNDKKESLSLLCALGLKFINEQRNRRLEDDRQKIDNFERGGLQFKFPITLFVNVFGAPGWHGYGSHICAEAQKANLPAYRCICTTECFSGIHHIHVKSISSICNGKLNKSNFPFEEFDIRYMGSESETAYFIGKLDGGVKNQRTLNDFFPVKKQKY